MNKLRILKTVYNFVGGSTVTHAAATIHSESDPSFLLHSKDGSTVLMQMVIYLSPGDYHRFHSPADWTVETKRCVFEKEYLRLTEFGQGKQNLTRLCGRLKLAQI